MISELVRVPGLGNGTAKSGAKKIHLLLQVHRHLAHAIRGSNPFPLQGSKTEGELPWADMDAAVIAIKNGTKPVTKGLMRKSLTALPLYFWISDEEERAGAE